ncbi:hypothetical protein NEF87_001898 [Candidatus Lokiarchaeum ossiferum]|uniref:RING-type domain-containing protein n=1 Tax=Candidatus Lokiarchaeum ossiferum TaxID=2951803 RepID=A0ABY6HQ19_9ARCH|nr:hypothetical protein NEF87_001898 [Candidatus Lokiarchaeum sp. B-35]
MHNIPSPKLPPSPPTTKAIKKENFCMIHKGPIQGETYTCKCGAQMCRNCATERKNNSQNRLCPVCSSVIFLKS